MHHSLEKIEHSDSYDMSGFMMRRIKSISCEQSVTNSLLKAITATEPLKEYTKYALCDSPRCRPRTTHLSTLVSAKTLNLYLV